MNKRISILNTALLTFLVLNLAFVTLAQERCVTDKLPGYNDSRVRDQFEQWMRNKQDLALGSQLRTEAVVQIPVVVHVIYWDEPVGSLRNIADEQIEAQIQVINEDFRRLNEDKENTPAVFLPVAADPEIEFVLAKQDPEGQPTNGIVRVQGCQMSWNWSEQTLMKSLSYWPSEDYLNIWVADLQGLNNQNVLGFSTFPMTDLQGVDFGYNPKIDGVAIDYTVFGSQKYYPQGDYNIKYNQGRTLTHELGHFFGLRHIWGDANSCSASDYCADTPPQLSSTSGCPSSPDDSCTGDAFPDMVQNYMDYTNDACMNLFTEDQKGRMQVVLANSPGRNTLSSSHALNDPVLIADNAGILEINSPGILQCEGNFIPSVTIRNYGNNAINSVQLELSINEVVSETLTFTVSIAPNQAAVLEFSEIPASPADYSFEILQVNGNTDNNSLNNSKTISSLIPSKVNTPFFEDFEDGAGDWINWNPDDWYGWELATAPSSSSQNKAMRLNFNDYENNGEIDYLISPVFDLTDAPGPFLHFDVAHAQFPNNDNDRLMVGVITGCEYMDIPVCSPMGMDIIYDKSSAELATVSSTQSSSFTPQNNTGWRSETFISLMDYAGMSEVQVVFISNNGYGNNVFIDNVLVTKETSLDIALDDVKKPGRYTCESQFQPEFSIRNAGSDIIQSFTINYSIDGGAATTSTYQGLSIGPGIKADILLDELSLTPGLHELAIDITQVNNTMDDFSDNNSIQYTFTIDEEVIEPPSRDAFDTHDPWYPWSQDPAIIWSSQNGSLQAPFYNASPPGSETWLFSKVYDMSEVSEASMFFDVAYSWTGQDDDQLYLMVSDDCGTTYENILYMKAGNNLSTATAQSNFTPSDGDWRSEFVLLNSIAGESKLRFAFRAVNQGGNNLYLDNVEIFIGDDPFPLETQEIVTHPYPNPTAGASFITFNLPEKENVNIRIVDRTGRQVFQRTMRNGLNQTVELDMRHEMMGLYIVLIEGETFSRAFRIALDR